jgi:hypothetical protein
MPATSNKQKQFMDAAAHNPKFAKAAGIPVSVAKEFSGASKGMKFGKGSDTSRADLQRVNKPKTLHGKMSIMKEGGTTMASKMNPGFMAMMAKKKGATKMASGGMPMKDGKPAFVGDGKGKMAKGGMAHKDVKMDKSMMQKAVNKHEGRLHKGESMTKLAKGGVAPSKMGSVKTSSSRDGIATKGKTKGKMVKMNMGGYAC